MTRSISPWLFALVLVHAALPGCQRAAPIDAELSAGVPIRQPDSDVAARELATRIDTAPSRRMEQAGLVGARGGVHVRLAGEGAQRFFLPLPQLTEQQIPLCYFVHSKDHDAPIEYRLHVRGKAGNTNDVVGVTVQGSPGDEVRLEWSAVILIRGGREMKGVSDPSFIAATSCVQSEAGVIATLAEQLWPESGETADYARNIQQHVATMKPRTRPRSLDAVAILESGANGICTANANLAAALLRHKGVPAQSLAVIPPIAQRLEMHRIVRYADSGRWARFDPSSVHKDVPMKPWQAILMSQTSLADEAIAMTPRMGVSRGCPYGQEVELTSDGVTLWGQDFFWTVAKPLVELEVDAETSGRVTAAWQRFRREGVMLPGTVRAAAATDAADFVERLTTTAD